MYYNSSHTYTETILSTTHQYEVTNLVLDLQNIIISDDDNYAVVVHSDGTSVLVPKRDQL